MEKKTKKIQKATVKKDGKFKCECESIPFCVVCGIIDENTNMLLELFRDIAKDYNQKE